MRPPTMRHQLLVRLVPWHATEAARLLAEWANHDTLSGYCDDDWLAEACRHTGEPAGLLVASQGPEPLACVPAAVTAQARFAGARLVNVDSLPFGAVGGYLLRPDGGRAAVAALRMLLRVAPAGLRFGSVWLRTRVKTLLLASDFQHLFDGLPSPLASTRNLAVLALPRTIDILRSRYSSHHRRNVRKSARLGCDVRTTDREHDLRAFHAMVLQTIERAGTEIHVPLSFFLPAAAKMIARGRAVLYMAHRDREALAGIFVVRDERRSFYWLGGMTRSATSAKVEPMFALFDRAFAEAVSLGHVQFELGGAPTEGLGRFKLGWGAELAPFVILHGMNPRLAPAYGAFTRARRLLRVADGPDAGEHAAT